MYRARRHYTLSDLPMIPHLRRAASAGRRALGLLLCQLAYAAIALGNALDSLAGAVLGIGPRFAYSAVPLTEIDLTDYADADTVVLWHRDPLSDTAESVPLSEFRAVAWEGEGWTAPALAPVATLASCRAAFCEPPVVIAQEPAPLTGEWTFRRDKAIVTLPVPTEEPSEPAPVEPAPVPASAAQTTRKPRKPQGKRCAVCHAVKPRSEFTTSENGETIRRNWCATCAEGMVRVEPATVAPETPESSPAEVSAEPEIAPQTQSQSSGFQAVVNRKALVSALTTTQRAVAKRTCKPILSCVRIVAADSGLSITGYDTEISVTVDCPAEVDSPGAGVVNGKDLLKLLKSSKEPQVCLAVDADGCRVLFADSEAKLPTFPVDEYPDAPAVPADRPTFTVDAGEMVKALARTTYAVDHNDTTRFALAGLYLEPEIDKFNRRHSSLTIVATNSKRLAVAVVPMEWQSSAPVPSKGKVNPYHPSMLIPAPAAELLRKSAPDGTLTVRFDPVYGVEIIAPGFRLHSRQIEGRYPPYRDIIGQTSKTASHKITLPVADFLSTLRQVETFTDDESKRVDLTFAPGKVEMRAQSAEKGSTSLTLPLPGCDVSAAVAFDPEYLADYLRALGKEPTTVLSLRDGTKPVIFQHNCESYRYLVMPLAG